MQREPISPTNEHGREESEQNDAVIGVALRWSLALFATVAIIAGAVYLWKATTSEPAEISETKLIVPKLREAPHAEMPQVTFLDITETAGITFRHLTGGKGEKLLPETMGSGCAFFDYDNDGDQDLILINSCQWPWETEAQETSEQRCSSVSLYRNDGAGIFEDVSEAAGLQVACYGMGVATADYDNDGFVDLFISNLGANRLYHNQGDGTFLDVTSEAGVAGADDAWSSSCGWFDMDNDGDVDLLVGNYLTWSRQFDTSQNFQLTGGGRAYGRPQNFEGTFPYLYRNDGNGRFTDVAEAAGLHVRNPATNVPMAKTLGLTFVDLDRDHFLDIVVANDTVQNFLFHNQGDGTFLEIGALTGIAFDMDGNARGAMGIDVAKFRDNDSVGVAIGNFSNEMTALYVSYGTQMQFMDEAISSGLGPTTRQALTFGLFFFDYDLDGRLDLFSANGHIEEQINRVQPSQHYEQSPQLFWNCGKEQVTEFMLVPEEVCGTALLRPMVGRGAAYGDIDGDGDLDIVVTGSGQPARLLRNDQQLSHHWIRLRLKGDRCNRDALGAWVEIETPTRTIRRQVMPTRSYLSQMELPVTIGLGEDAEITRAVVTWPDGTSQRLETIPLDHPIDVVQSAP